MRLPFFSAQIFLPKEAVDNIVSGVARWLFACLGRKGSKTACAVKSSEAGISCRGKLPKVQGG